VRRRRSKQERRQIVEETLEPGASVAVIARAHGVNANQVFHWRKLYRERRLELKPCNAQLMPVRITETVDEHKPLRAGVIHIEVGRTCIRVEGAVDRETLRTVLERLAP
jgi:transposase